VLEQPIAGKSRGGVGGLHEQPPGRSGVGPRRGRRRRGQPQQRWTIAQPLWRFGQRRAQERVHLERDGAKEILVAARPRHGRHQRLASQTIDQHDLRLTGRSRSHAHRSQRPCAVTGALHSRQEGAQISLRRRGASGRSRGHAALDLDLEALEIGPQGVRQALLVQRRRHRQHQQLARLGGRLGVGRTAQ
jgi:hypothetical protein